MSAQAALAGLFTPTDDEKWNEDISWQPIPVHTLPRKFDHVIAIEQNCPKYKDLLAKYTNKSKERQRIFTEYADLISYWSNMSGQNLTSTYDIYWLFNTLDIEREQNKRFVISNLILHLFIKILKTLMRKFVIDFVLHIKGSQNGQRKRSNTAA